MWGKLAPQRQREHFVPTLGTPARTREMPIGRNDEAERTHEEPFEKISHAPYHSAKILFYFCPTNFFRSAFSSLATRKNDASSPPSAATAKGRNSTLWTPFKNKPTFRKNTTTFLTFSTGLKQGIITRRNNIRPEVKFLAHFTSSHAHYARIHCFSVFCLHSFTHPSNTLTIKTLRVKTSPSFAFTFLHPFSPSIPLHR